MATLDTQAYWDQRHAENFGPESVGYAGLGVPYNVWMYRVRAHVVAREIRRAGIPLPDCHVLDVGSGTGFYIDLWSRLGAKSVAGCDFAPYAVGSLRRRFPDNAFFELDISSAELPEHLGQADVVSAFDILYHIVEDAKYAQAFRNVRALLRPGGVFVFSENFLPGARETHGHQVSRSYEEIAHLLAENEFEILRRAPVFFLMNRPVKSSSRVLSTTWRLIERVASRRHQPWLGACLGAALYPFEITTLSWMQSGPTTEMMICRRRT